MSIISEDNFQHYSVRVGSFEGHPIMSEITVEDQRQAAKDGVSLQDLIDIEKDAYRDWQSDC